MPPNKRSRFPLLSRTVKEPLPPVQPSVDTDDDETQDPYGFTHPAAWDTPPGFHRASQNLADLLGTSMPPSPPTPVSAPRASTSTPCLEEDSGPSEISPSTSDVHAHPSSSTPDVDAQGTQSNTGGPQLQQLGPHQVRTIDREGVIKVISVPKPSDIWRLGKDERVMIEFNTTFQPVGPGSAKLRRIAGMLIRSGHFACLEVKDWRTVDPQPKEDIWTILMTKFYVETDQQLSEIKKVTFQDLGRKRKDFKYGIKQSLKLKEYRTPDQVIEATPKTNIISPKTLEVLVEQWFTEDDMKRAEKNKKSRGEQKFPHSSGSKSFARLAKERETTSGYPNRSQLFMVTHVKKDGTPVNDVAAAKMAQMKEIMAEGGPTSTLCAHGSISWAPNDPYSQVMGPERAGRVRGVGLGLTPGRGRYNSSGASTSANQPHLVSQVNKLEAEIGQMRTQHQDEMHQMRTDHQNEMIQMQKIMDVLMRVGPGPNIPGTTSRGDIADKDDAQVGDKGGGEGTRK